MPSVTVLNDSGKVIKNGKFLNEVFKDARAAYRERKAEIKAIRTSNLDEDKSRRALNRLDASDHERRSPTASRRSSIQSTASTRRKQYPDRPDGLRVDSRRGSQSSTHDHRERREHRDRYESERDYDDRRERREHRRRREHHSDHESPRSPKSERGDYDYARSSRSNRADAKATMSPKVHKSSRLRFEDSLSDLENESRGKELVRRNTDGMVHRMRADLDDDEVESGSRRNSQAPPRSPRPSHSRRSSLAPSVTPARPNHRRAASMTEMEMSLAYGDAPPGFTGALSPPPEEGELRGQITKLQKLLDEAHCMESSVKAMITSLAKNPDQLAAAGLMLGEISTLVAKAGPAALSSMKVSFPAVFALLAAPEFAIAAGVGVGVTVIALGSYKIIKRVKKKKAAQLAAAAAAENKALPEAAAADDDEEDELAADELQEIRSDISRIEVWRRGIADVHMDSEGTSVDGEFITPAASQKLIKEGKMKESDLKRSKSKKEKSKKDADDDETSSVFGRGKAFIKDPNGLRSLFKKNEKPPALPARPASTLA